jgi:hypothetical protein
MIYLFSSQIIARVLTSSKKITARKRWGDAPEPWLHRRLPSWSRFDRTLVPLPIHFLIRATRWLTRTWSKGAARGSPAARPFGSEDASDVPRKTALAQRLEVRLPVELRWCRRLNKDSCWREGGNAFGTMLRDSEDANGDAVIGLDDQVSSNRP